MLCLKISTPCKQRLWGLVPVKKCGSREEHKADCAAKNASCAGHNSAGDPEAWILVPAGECAKINKGDYIGVSKEIMDKLDVEQPKK